MRNTSGIGVLDKAMTVLYAVAEQPCLLSELCEQTGLPRATAHRLAVGLEVHQLLTRDSSGVWQLGPGFAKLASQAGDSLVEACAQVLPRLRSMTDESVQVYRRDGMQRVCIASAEPASGLRNSVPVGTTYPMTGGSAAKALLAWSDVATQRAVLVDAVFNERILAEVRRRGWAQSAAEREAGVASVSAPIRDASGTVIAALSISGPIDRIGRRPGSRWAVDLLAAAEAIQRRL